MIHGSLVASNGSSWTLEVNAKAGDAEHFDIQGRVTFSKSQCRKVRSDLGNGMVAIVSTANYLRTLGNGPKSRAD